jgi:hypothetical protein
MTVSLPAAASAKATRASTWAMSGRSLGGMYAADWKLDIAFIVSDKPLNLSADARALEIEGM